MKILTEIKIMPTRMAFHQQFASADLEDGSRVTINQNMHDNSIEVRRNGQSAVFSMRAIMDAGIAALEEAEAP